MKIYKGHYIGKIFAYILLWFLLTGYSYQALAEEPSGETIRIIPDEEIPIILDLIANRIHDNYERLITWSGQIDVKLNMLHTGTTAEEVFQFTDAKVQRPEAILQKVEEKITFAIDAKKNFVYVDKFREKPSKYFNYSSGEDLGNSGSSPYWSTSIGRPGFLLEAKFPSYKDNKIVHRRAFKKPSQQDSVTGLYYKDFRDPRQPFFPGGGFTWEHFDRLIKRINKFGKIEFDGYSLNIEEHKKGGIIEYKIIEPSIVNLERSSPDHYIIKSKVFSAHHGFNMIYWEVTSGGGIPLQKFTWEYELINGVYLPKRVVEKRYNSSGDVGLGKESTYINNKVNQEIPPETFEYTNLNLKDMDIFIDEILNKEYRYKAATRTLEPVEK